MLKIYNVQYESRATFFDSTESSSVPRGVDPYKECPTNCGIPNAHNSSSEIQSSR